MCGGGWFGRMGLYLQKTLTAWLPMESGRDARAGATRGGASRRLCVVVWPAALAGGVLEAAALVAQAPALADAFAQEVELGSAGVAAPNDLELGHAR